MARSRRAIWSVGALHKKPGTKCICGSGAMIEKCLSTFALARRPKRFFKSWRIHTAAQRQSEYAKGFFAAPRSQSRPRLQPGEGSRSLTLTTGFERVLRNHASRHFHLHLSSAVCAPGGPSAAFIYPDFSQSRTLVLGRSERNHVSYARGRRSGSSQGPRAHSGGCVPVCGESHEFGGRSRGCRRDSTARGDSAEAIAF